MYYVYIQIIEQERNKMAIHTHVIFSPRNVVLFIEYLIGNNDVIVILYG